MTLKYRWNDEWLEADGLGGFASGTVSGIRTRRYHALLVNAVTPPTSRFALVNGFEAWVETGAGSFALTSHAYAPCYTYPNGAWRIESFEYEPWPRWIFRLEDGTRIEQEIFSRKGLPFTVVSWRLLEMRAGVSLSVRPLLSGRDHHALHKQNPVFCFDASVEGERVSWRPYPGVPGITAISNGSYLHEPLWYRDFLYEEERDRGLDHTEDLASPGTFRWNLSQTRAIWILGVEGAQAPGGPPAAGLYESFRESEARRREHFVSRLHQSADAYVVRRGKRQTIIAGYPWFTDWGRDTFISLRGFCLAGGRPHEARDILIEWAGLISEGMLPNRFPDGAQPPEYNSVDAALWYVIAVADLFETLKGGGFEIGLQDLALLETAVDTLLSGYAAGTRFGIHMTEDGLLACGVPGSQLTWMDARAGGEPVTPRVGKPVEIQALWLNALAFAANFSKRWEQVFENGSRVFRERFWNEKAGCLFDVVDADHAHGRCDGTLRPNQIFAVGGLSRILLEPDRARRVTEVVESVLWTPLGLRTLAPSEPGYCPRYQGSPEERNRAYHQGTAWPWLLGPFVEAWVRIRGGSPEVLREARTRFLDPLLRRLNEGGLGHLPEIADGDSPHHIRGCPFQAWSVAEALRLSERVLAVRPSSKTPVRA